MVNLNWCKTLVSDPFGMSTLTGFIFTFLTLNMFTDPHFSGMINHANVPSVSHFTKFEKSFTRAMFKSQEPHQKREQLALLIQS